MAIRLSGVAASSAWARGMQAHASMPVSAIMHRKRFTSATDLDIYRQPSSTALLLGRVLSLPLYGNTDRKRLRTEIGQRRG